MKARVILLALASALVLAGAATAGRSPLAWGLAFARAYDRAAAAAGAPDRITRIGCLYRAGYGWYACLIVASRDRGPAFCRALLVNPAGAFRAPAASIVFNGPANCDTGAA